MWKQQVVVLNRPGAGGLIAAQAAAAAEKDGYTLYMTQSSTWTVLPVLQEGKIPGRPEKAFVPIGMVGEQPIASGGQQGRAGQERGGADRLANKQPDGMLFAATNRGGQSHLTGELFRDRAKVNMSFVHSAGRGHVAERRHRRAYPDHVRGPRWPPRPESRAAASGCSRVAAAKRLPNLPDLPTISRNRAGRGVERLARADGAEPACPKRSSRRSPPIEDRHRQP